MKTDQSIKTDIAKFGVSLCAVTDAINKGGRNKSEKWTAMGKLWDGIASGFVYTIGHNERDRPDLLAYCGPKPGDPAFSTHVLRDQMMAAASMINHLVSEWDRSPVYEGHECLTASGRIYVAKQIEGADADLLKASTTCQAGFYYGHDDYSLMLLLPKSWLSS